MAAQEAEFELAPKHRSAYRVEPDVPEIFFTRDLKGYGWVIRKGSYLNIGPGRQDTHQLGEHVAQFVAFLEQRGRIPVGLPARFHGHPYLLYGKARRPLLGDAALLIGDAAGLAYSRSGERIRPAIEFALFAHSPSSRPTATTPAIAWRRMFARHVVLQRWFLHAHQPPLSAGQLQAAAPTARRRALADSISTPQTAG